LTPSSIPYAAAAATCLFVSYQFSKRIGKPNERVQRRRNLMLDKQRTASTPAE
jgi:hypothetical protein